MTTTQTLPTSERRNLEVVLNDPAALVRFASAVTGLPESDVAKRLIDENSRIGSSVWRELETRQIVPFQWSEALVEFYETTTAFIFESIVWNRSSIKQQMRQWIVDFLEQEFSKRPLEVLVFGDGLGFDSTFLALAGHHVSYFEVSRKAISFASSVFEACDCNVEIFTSIDQVCSRKYDAVVCLDVLEHVQDPVQLVELLASVLRMDGRMIVHAPFWYLDKSVGTHLATNRKFSGDLRCLYRPHGLRAVDAAMFWNPIAFAPEAIGKNHDKVNLPARVRIALGGSLLSIGRFWSMPHALITSWMLARSLGKWPEMERFASEGGT